jgi:predicted dehydrogenase
MGRMHANVYRQLPNVQLVGCVDKRAEKAEEFARDFECTAYPSIEAALEATGATILDVCLPTYQHCEATLIGAKYGRNVFCEKPLAINLEQADQMIAACQEAGVQLMVGHCIRFWPEYAILKGLVDNKTLGDLQCLNLTRYGEFPSWASDNWQADEAKAGGGALDMRIHDTDFALYLLGEPDSIHSWGQLDDRGVGYSITTMTFGKTVALLEGGWSWPPKTPFKMEFRAMFSGGAAIMESGPLTIYPANGEPYKPEIQQMSASGGGNISSLGGYYLEIKDFIDALEENRPLTVVTPESSRRSLDVALEEIRQIKAFHGR